MIACPPSATVRCGGSERRSPSSNASFELDGGGSSEVNVRGERDSERSRTLTLLVVRVSSGVIGGVVGPEWTDV